MAYPGTVTCASTPTCGSSHILDSLAGTASGASLSSTATAATHRPRRRDGVDGTPRRARTVPQLVERAQDLGHGPGGRPGRLARLLDGELPLDAAPGVDLPREEKPRSTSTPCGRCRRRRARLPGRRQLRRPLPAPGRRMLRSGRWRSRRPASLLEGPVGPMSHEAPSGRPCGSRSSAPAPSAARWAPTSCAPGTTSPSSTSSAEHVEAIRRGGLRIEGSDRHVHGARSPH